MSWTLNDFIALDSQYEYKIQRQEVAVCKQVSVDIPSITNFQQYVASFQFQRKRFGYLYGKFVPVTDDTNSSEEKSTSTDQDKKQIHQQRVIVEAIYEPPQEVDSEAAEGFVPADEDPHEGAVATIVKLLGLQKVGWIVCHEPGRKPGYVLSSAEIIMAAEYQLEAADGVNETPFVTIIVSPSSEDSGVKVEAYQVSQQCMAMVAEEALEVNGADLTQCFVNDTFTALQEGKPSKTVDNNFFLTVVPIVQHTSAMFVADFPYMNRDIDTRSPSQNEMKKQLSQSGKAGWTFVDRLADLNLLIYLSDYLDVGTDYPKICQAIVNRETQDLDDGYKLIIKSLAGLDGSY
jgi:nuclear protein localization protein 4 homolog